MPKVFKCKYCRGEHSVENGWAYCPNVFGGWIKFRKRKVMRNLKKCVDPVAKYALTHGTGRVYILQHPHMKYNTYAVLRDFIEEQKRRVHHEYITASDHTYEWEYDGSSPPKFNRGKVLPQSVRDFMWKNYQKQMQYYEDMLKQLYYAAQESNRSHPNPDMRAFWGVKES